VKLAHIADPHLGLRQYHRQTPGGINQREADVAHAFRAAIDGVIAARPDAVVVAGDLFHSVRPTNAAIIFAFRHFQRLREALPDAPIVLIAGNHDTPRSVETGSILRLFEELGVDVAADEARRLEYPALYLSVLALPHQARAGAARPSLRPEGGA
jgi:exonuclease SbcD